MAGAGFKDFANGNILTGDELDTYLMQQSVMTFATAGDRDTALAAVVANGMVAYTVADDMMWQRRGGLWLESRPWLVRKTADETVNNLASVQGDDHLIFPAMANGVYDIDVRLFVQSGSSAADLRIGWSMPAGGTINFGASAPDIAIAASTSGNAPAQAEWNALLGAVSGTQVYGVNAGAAQNTFIRISGTFVNSSTAGKLSPPGYPRLLTVALRNYLVRPPSQPQGPPPCPHPKTATQQTTSA
jgi:hypothetical protein